ncbi:hypothetical protein BDW02DRAFT_84032 [Decorospora gaudefroyi]|uniref:Uncharacterized protein n=1 Tax=Decorospora gaudefroyi TaxID=184978 RepID=A0A6A5KPG8_9PLEO|nr:hypothetical protein BDW02DRAFT_84032 [Decorospora gaudefroyi]
MFKHRIPSAGPQLSSRILVRRSFLLPKRGLSTHTFKMSPIPIILCGRNPALAQSVQKNLMPEYDVTHIIPSPFDGAREIPLLLTKPPTVLANS